MTDRPLPTAVGSEAALLGGLLDRGDLFPTVRDLVRVGDFTRPEHGALWALFGEMFDAGAPLEVVAVVERVRRGGRHYPDLAYVASLPDLAGPAPSNLAHYARTVADAAYRWRVEGALRDAVERLQRGAEAPELVAGLVADLEAARSRTTAAADLTARWHVAEVARELTDRGAEGVTFLPWPGVAGGPRKDRGGATTPSAFPSNAPTAEWRETQRAIGSLWPDRLAVLVGPTGRGKSAWALQVAESVARAGHPVVYASLEMGGAELVARLVSVRSTSGVAYADLLTAPPRDLGEAVGILVEKCPALYLWVPSGRERGLAGLAALAQAVADRHEGRPPLIVVDYLQRLVDGAAGDDRRSAVADLSGSLRSLSRPGGLGRGWPGAAVLALSSTARDKYGLFGTVAKMEAANQGGDLVGTGKETGEIEYDASLVLALTCDLDGPPARRTGALVVAKDRHGPGGSVGLVFNAPCGRWTEERKAAAHKAAATSTKADRYGSDTA